MLERLASDGEDVALIAADLRLPGMDGVAFLEQAQELHRDASRVSLLAMDQYHTRIPFTELATLQLATALGRILRTDHQPGQLGPSMLQDLLGDRRIKAFNDRFQLISKAQQAFSSGSLMQQLFGGLLGAGKVVLGAVFSGVTLLILTLYFLASLFPCLAADDQECNLSIDTSLFESAGSRPGGYDLRADQCLHIRDFCRCHDCRDLVVHLPAHRRVERLRPGARAADRGLRHHSFDRGDHRRDHRMHRCLRGLDGRRHRRRDLLRRVSAVRELCSTTARVQRAVDVPGALAVIAALIGAALLGVVGALLAVPVAAALLMLLRDVAQPRLDAG